MMWPVTAVLVLCSLLCSALPARAACELEPGRAIAGSPLSYWTAELASRDRGRVQAARAALGGHPVDGLAAILAAKSTAKNATAGRRLHRDVEELFEGAGAATAFLTPYLSCEDARVREAAVQLLGWIGPAAAEALPAVVAALADEDGGVRMQAGFTVARIGVVDDAVLTALSGTLADENWRAANAAASALAGFWPRSRATLTQALAAEPARARYYAMRAVKRLPEVEPRLVALLVERAERDVTRNRGEALERLRDLEPTLVTQYLERLEPLLEDGAVRCEAARLLVGRVGPRLEPTLVATFIELMQLPQTRRREDCHEHVHKDLPLLGAQAIEPLAALLRHPEPHVRLNALIALSRIEPRPPVVYDRLLAVLDDAELRDLIGHVLAGSGAEAIPALRRMLRHDDPAVRATAAQAAMRLGATVRPLVPLLMERLPLERGPTRKALVQALGFVGGEAATAALPELRRAAQDPDLHAEAISAVARIAGSAAVELAPELIAALADQSQGMCPHPTADDDLRAIGPAAVPAIVEALAGEQPVPRLPLLRLLDEWGDDALAAAAPVLERWVDAGEPFALDAAERLWRLGRLDAARAEPVFTRAFESATDWTRIRGAEGLVRLGGASCVAARAALAEMLEHRHESYRDRARIALEHTCP